MGRQPTWESMDAEALLLGLVLSPCRVDLGADWRGESARDPVRTPSSAVGLHALVLENAVGRGSPFSVPEFFDARCGCTMDVPRQDAVLRGRLRGWPRRGNTAGGSREPHRTNLWLDRACGERGRMLPVGKGAQGGAQRTRHLIRGVVGDVRRLPGAEKHPNRRNCHCSAWPGRRATTRFARPSSSSSGIYDACWSRRRPRRTWGTRGARETACAAPRTTPTATCPCCPAPAPARRARCASEGAARTSRNSGPRALRAGAANPRKAAAAGVRCAGAGGAKTHLQIEGVFEASWR